jgi:hypothetical protein
MARFSPAHQSSSDVRHDTAMRLLLTIDGSIGADSGPRIGWPMEAVALAEQEGDEEEEIVEDDEDDDEDDEDDEEVDDDEDELDEDEDEDEDEEEEEDEEDELESRGTDAKPPVL